MKNILRSSKIILAGCLVFIITGAPGIHFDVMIPSYISLPENIQKVALVDRSVKNEKGLQAAGSLLSGEVFRQDKNTSFQVLEGLISQLNSTRKLTAVRTSRQLMNDAQGKALPSLLSWEEVESLCAEFNTDALLALEVYDSDFIPGYNEVNVTIGFRIYDPLTKLIGDQFVFTHRAQLGGQANSVLGTVGLALEKENAVRDLSFHAGMLYGRRICPFWINVERTYYRKPRSDQNLAAGARMMEVNDWNGAIASLQKAAENGKKRKTRGRASHNLAVVYEITGDLNAAITWAQSAWTNHRNKDSKEYLYELNVRKNEIQALENQN